MIFILYLNRIKLIKLLKTILQIKFKKELVLIINNKRSII